MEKNKRRFFFSVFVQDLFAIPLSKFFIRFSFHPNLVTFFGFISSIISGIFFLEHNYYVGSLLFFLALVFDSTDGRVARGTNRFSDFGALLDSITDKIRSFYVAFCFIWSLGFDLTFSLIIFSYYILLPVFRFFLSRADSQFYDPTILFWDATPFVNWFIKKNVLGFYTGWERSVLALVFAPLVYFKIELFIFSVLLEQLLFIIGLFFCKKYKKGI